MAGPVVAVGRGLAGFVAAFAGGGGLDHLWQPGGTEPNITNKIKATDIFLSTVVSLGFCEPGRQKLDKRDNRAKPSL